MKKAIEAIKNDLNDFNEDCLKEIAYNEKDFNNRIFVFSYSNDVNYLYIVNVHPEGSVDVENYYYEYGYSIENK
jgi:hypothetical protein